MSDDPTPPVEPGPTDPGTPNDPPASPPPPPPPAEPPKSFLESIPEDWRTQTAVAMANGDEALQEKLATRFERFKTPVAAFQAGFDSMDKIRAGETSTGLPENPTDEQLAAYREANGVPPEADKYDLKLEDGVVLSAGDQEVINQVMPIAHALNISNEGLSQLAGGMLKAQAAQLENIEQQDGLDTQKAEQLLKQEWGADYKANKMALEAFKDRLPKDVREAFENARLQGGQALFNNPHMINMFVGLERQVNPAGLVVPNSDNPVASIKEEIKSLESRMGTPEWYKDKDAQQRLRDLYNAEERLAAQPA